MQSSRELYVCARMLWPLIAGLRYLGLPADDLMRQAGLPEAQLLEGDRRLPLEAPLRLIELAIAHHGEGIGLELARLYELGGFGLLDLIAQTSHTLGEAITYMCQYEQANQNALESWLEVRDGQAILSQRHFHALPVPRQLTENSLANLVLIGRKLTQHEKQCVRE